MSPQFVDFNADGQLDIVAGTFDGSPHLSRGSAAGWLPPEQILAADGNRIVLEQFWNFDTKKWDSAARKIGDEFRLGGAHATSAIAFDWDGDGADRGVGECGASTLRARTAWSRSRRRLRRARRRRRLRPGGR